MSLRTTDDKLHGNLFGSLIKISYFNNDKGNKVKVKLVGDCNCLFEGNEEFNENINDWGVSEVNNMEGMFYDCQRFNQPINRWDVSNVQNMRDMFSGCGSFNQPLNDWNVGNVQNMWGMFSGCESFNQPLNKWDTSRVTDMEYMFDECHDFNQSLRENIVINESKKEEIINSLPENIPMALIEHIILKYASYKAWDVSQVTKDIPYTFSDLEEENRPLRFR